MPSFDRRVVSDELLHLVRVLQARGGGHLGGGAVLAGVHLAHRRTRDLDLFLHDKEAHRELVRALPAVATETGLPIHILRDGGEFVRAAVFAAGREVELDLVYEAVPDIERPPAPVEGIVVESLADLRASKLTCVLSRSEPRDLVDLLFLDKKGFPPEADLPLALRKDAGIDPGILAWLLERFPTAPLPEMLVPLSEQDLRAWRDKLAERLRAASLPE